MGSFSCPISLVPAPVWQEGTKTGTVEVGESTQERKSKARMILGVLFLLKYVINVNRGVT